MPAGYEYLADSSSGVLFGPKWHECQYSGCLYGGAWGTPPFPFMVSWAPDGKGGYYFVSDTIPGTIVTNGNVYERDAAGTITLVWKVPLVIGVSSVSAMETFSN